MCVHTEAEWRNEVYATPPQVGMLFLFMFAATTRYLKCLYRGVSVCAYSVSCLVHKVSKYDVMCNSIVIIHILFFDFMH